MAIKTPLTELLDIEHPILLAPMDVVSGGRLAAAVSAAGGLGLIGGGYGDGDWIEGEFAAAGDQVVGAGFITWSLAKQPELLDRALEHDPTAIMLSFGDPAPFVGKIKDAGAKLICQVQTVADARAAVDLGADVIIAQGTEGGGHGATRATFTLTPAVVDAIAPVPVAAAGGVADGRGLAAALMLGAAGVLVGTRFYAAEEALGADAAKARIVEASGDETVRGKVFDIVRQTDWPEHLTGRVLKNDFAKRWFGSEANLKENLAAEVSRYDKAKAQGDFDVAAVIAGECVDLIHDLPPAGEIIVAMVRDAEALLKGGWTC